MIRVLDISKRSNNIDFIAIVMWCLQYTLRKCSKCSKRQHTHHIIKICRSVENVMFVSAWTAGFNVTDVTTAETNQSHTGRVWHVMLNLLLTHLYSRVSSAQWHTDRQQLYLHWVYSCSRANSAGVSVTHLSRALIVLSALWFVHGAFPKWQHSSNGTSH